MPEGETLKARMRSSWRTQMSCGLLAVLSSALACTGPNPEHTPAIVDAGTGDGGLDTRPDTGPDTGAEALPGGVPDAHPGADASPTGPDATPDAAGDVPPGAASLRVGLVGFWDCDRPANPGQLTDTSGADHHATLSGLDPATSWVAGRRGDALAIPDVQGGALVAATPAIDGLQRLTLAVWVKRTQNLGGRHAAVISRHFESGSREIYNLAFNNNALVLYLFSAPPAAVISVASTTPAPVGSWVHVAFTYDGQTARIYQAGRQVAQLAYTGVFPSSPNQLVIGNNSNRRILDQPLVGALDDVAVYDRALSATEIDALAQGAVP